MRHCHELIEASLRDSDVRSDASNEASSSSSRNNHHHSDDDDDDDDDDRQTKSAAGNLPTTPTDVRDISLVNADD